MAVRAAAAGWAVAALPVPAEMVGQLVTWLPPDLRDEAAAMLTAGRRMAQEAVGYRALREWLRDDPGALLSS